MSKERVSIKDLARQLGIAPSTVSRALNNKGRVAQKTQERIVELANQLGYRPHPFASNLAKKKTGLIGLLLPEFTHHYFAKVLSGVNEAMNQYGYQLIINIHEGQFLRERESLKMFSKMHVEGVIASYAKETINFDHYIDLIEDHIPLVFVDRMSEDLDVSYVISDDFKGSTRAVDHLIDLGRKRIAYVSGPENLSTTFTRKIGYEEGLRKHGLGVNRHWLIAQDQPNWSELLVRLIKEEGINAVMTYTDYLAFETVESLKQVGICIPEEVSVVGFADEPIAQYMTPQLTTVVQPAYKMGKRAAEILLGALQKNDTTLYQERLSTHIVTRSSTALFSQ